LPALLTGLRYILLGESGMKVYIIFLIMLLVDNFSRLEAQTNSGVGPAEIAEQTGVINDARVRLRAQPNLKSEVLAYFNFGDNVKVIGTSAEKQNIDGMESVWYRIRTNAHVEGWVFGAYVDLYTDLLENQADSEVSVNDGKSQNIWALPNYKNYEEEIYEREDTGERIAALEEHWTCKFEELKEMRLAWLLRNIGADFALSQEEMIKRYGDSYDLDVRAVDRTNDYIAYVYTYRENRKENIRFDFLENKDHGRMYFTGWTIYSGFTLSGFICPKTKSEWYTYFGKETDMGTRRYNGVNWIEYHFLKSVHEYFIFQIYLDDDLETILRVSCEVAE
jgi:hypothetical protein